MKLNMRLDQKPQLKIGNSVAAILVNKTNQYYVMQLRDQKPEIFHPGCWGCFGGALEVGETNEEALRRELFEELEFQFESCKLFMEIGFEHFSLGLRPARRTYYEILVDEQVVKGFILKEGQQVKALDGNNFVENMKSIPLDAFAVWSHMNQSLLE